LISFRNHRRHSSTKSSIPI